MKTRSIPLLITLFLFTVGNTFAQSVTLTASQETVYPGGTVSVKVSASGFQNVTSAKLEFQYDQPLTYLSNSVHSALSGASVTSGNPRKLYFNWNGPGAASVVDGTTILELQFAASTTPGTARVYFANGAPKNNVVNVNNAEAVLTLNDGSVNILRVYTLSVDTQGDAAGTSVSVSPTDKNGMGSAVAPFDRLYDDGTTVTVTAPATDAVGNVFRRWLLNGAGATTDLSLPVLMRNNHSVVAVYEAPSADLALTNTADKSIVNESEEVTYTLTVSNAGPDGATNVAVTVPTPDNLTFVSVNPSSLSGSNGEWTINNLAAGSSTQFSLTYRVNTGSSGATITHIASVSALNPSDPAPGNNTAGTSITLNRAPVVSDAIIDLALARGASFSRDLLVSPPVFEDADGDALTYSVISSDETVVTASMTASNLVINAIEEGTASITLTAEDGKGGQVDLIIEVMVQNSSPVAGDDSGETDEDTPVVLSVLANDQDPDSDAIIVSAVNEPANGTAVITGDGTTIQYTPDENFSGSDTFSYTVQDTKGATDQAQVTVTVNAVPDDPHFVTESLSTLSVNQVFNLSVSAADPDEGDQLTLALLSSEPAWLQLVNQENGTGTLIGTASSAGDYDIVLKVTDQTGRSAERTFVLKVSATNQPPQAVADAVSTNEDVPLSTIPVLDNDVDTIGDVLTIIAVSNPNHGSAAITTGGKAVDYAPDADFHGQDTFTYTLRDQNGAEAQAVVTVTIRPVNDAPVAREDGVNLNGRGPIDIEVLNNDTDIDGDVLNVTGITNVVGGSTDINPNGTIRFTPGSSNSGSFTYTISDGNGGSDEATVQIRIEDEIVDDDDDIINNDDESGTPRTRSDVATTRRNEPVTIDVLANDTDPDGDELSLIRVSRPDHGTAEIVNQQVRYSPHPDFIGEEDFTYTITDGENTETGFVYVTVEDTDGSTPDVVVNLDVTTPEDTPVQIDLPASPILIQHSGLSFNFVKKPAHGIISTSGENSGTISNISKLVYVPERDFFGTDIFTYEARDGKGGTTLATIKVTVTPVNDAPTAPVVTSPTAGSTVVIGGDRVAPMSPGTEFMITWDPSVDVEKDEISYTMIIRYAWYIAVDDTLVKQSAVVTTDAGTELEIAIPYGKVAQMLDQANVDLDRATVLDFSVIASDGKLSTESEVVRVKLARGTLTDTENASDLPTEFTLEGNYPNPFNPSTNIRFGLPETAEVRVEVYDLAGRRVLEIPTRTFPAGTGSIQVDAGNLTSGAYLYRLLATTPTTTSSATGQMVLVK